MSTLKYILTISLLAWLCACETIVEIDLPEHTSRLVVHGYLFPDSVFKVRVSSSQHILVPGYNFPSVEGAKVDIYENGTLLETLSLASDGQGTYYRGQGKPAVGRTYEVRVQAEGYEEARGRAQVPQAVAITEATIVGKRSNEFGETLTDFRIRLNDPSETANYYGLNLYQVEPQIRYLPPNFEPDTVGYFVVPIPIETNAPLLKRAPSGFVLQDGGLNGRSIELLVSSSAGGIEGMNLVAELRSASESYFRYQNTLQRHIDAQDGIFGGEPVNVYSNIENGFGVIAAYQQVWMKVN